MQAVKISYRQHAGSFGRSVVSVPRRGRCKGAYASCTLRRWLTRVPILILRLVGYVYADIELQTIVSQLHMGKSCVTQALVGFRVRQVVRDMREPRAFWSQPLYQRQGLLPGLMHRVRNIAQRIN